METQKYNKKFNVLESIPYSQIISLVANGENCAEKISTRRKIDPSATATQLRKLLKNKFLISVKESEGKKLQYNRTLYRVNFEKVLEDFIDYSTEKLILLIKKEKEDAHLTENLENIKDKKFLLELKHNKYLLVIIQSLLKANETEALTNNKTIKQSFDDLLDTFREKFCEDIRINLNEIIECSLEKIEGKSHEEVKKLWDKIEDENDFQGLIGFTQMFAELDCSINEKIITDLITYIIKENKS